MYHAVLVEAASAAGLQEAAHAVVKDACLIPALGGWLNLVL